MTLKELLSNPANVAVLAVIAILCFLTLRYLIRNQRAGKPSCGSNCAGCPSAGHCHHGADHGSDQ